MASFMACRSPLYWLWSFFSSGMCCCICNVERVDFRVSGVTATVVVRVKKATAIP